MLLLLLSAISFSFFAFLFFSLPHQHKANYISMTIKTGSGNLLLAPVLAPSDSAHPFNHVPASSPTVSSTGAFQIKQAVFWFSPTPSMALLATVPVTVTGTQPKPKRNQGIVAWQRQLWSCSWWPWY